MALVPVSIQAFRFSFIQTDRERVYYLFSQIQLNLNLCCVTTPLIENSRTGGVGQGPQSQEGCNDIWDERDDCRTDNRKHGHERDRREDSLPLTEHEEIRCKKCNFKLRSEYECVELSVVVILLHSYRQFRCDSVAVKTKLWCQAAKALNLQETWTTCIKLFYSSAPPMSVFFIILLLLGQCIADRNVALQKPLGFSWTGTEQKHRHNRDYH